MQIKTGMMTVGAVCAAAAAGGLIRSHYERDHFVVETAELSSEKLRSPRTLVFLSDMHDKEFGKGNQRLLDAVRRESPDAVLIGGDTMIVKKKKADLGATGRLLAGLSELCPVYYGNGNHEQRLKRETNIYGGLYQRFRELLERYGVVYLQNQSADLGEDIRISGLDVEKPYYRNFFPEKMREDYISRRLGAADQERYQILLVHSPLFQEAYGAWGADLALAGHFHGGTIRLPVLGGVMTPQYQFFLPCCAGTFEKDGRSMIVSRGLGTHSINIRFCNLPQVVVIKLFPSKSGACCA